MKLPKVVGPERFITLVDHKSRVVDTAEHCTSSDREVSPSDTKRIMPAVVESRPNMFTNAKDVARDALFMVFIGRRFITHGVILG